MKQAASPGCLTDNLGWLLGQAEHVLAAEMSARLEPLGLSSRRYCVLASAMTGDHTQIELANMVGLDKTTMVVTLDGLEADGLAKRMPSSRDRRVRVMAVTEAGERRVAKARRSSSPLKTSARPAARGRARRAPVGPVPARVRRPRHARSGP